MMQNKHHLLALTHATSHDNHSQRSMRGLCERPSSRYQNDDQDILLEDFSIKDEKVLKDITIERRVHPIWPYTSVNTETSTPALQNPKPISDSRKFLSQTSALSSRNILGRTYMRNSWTVLSWQCGGKDGSQGWSVSPKHPIAEAAGWDNWSTIVGPGHQERDVWKGGKHPNIPRAPATYNM